MIRWKDLSPALKTIIATALVILFVPVARKINDMSLYRNAEFTQGEIVELTEKQHQERFYYGAKVVYVYSVNGVKYTGSGDRAMNTDRIGDPVAIVYNKAKPAKSKPCREYKYSQNCPEVRR